MSEGTVLVVFCETCEEETPHLVLRGELKASPSSGFEGSVRCQRCSTVHHANIPSEKPMTLPMVLSEGERSRNQTITVSPLEELCVGEEMMIEDNNVMLTSLVSGGRNVSRAKGKDISLVYAKVYDSVVVKVSISRGSTTRSESLHVPPDEEFQVGDILEFGRTKVATDRILADQMVSREGIPVKAKDIKRIYGKMVRERNY